MSSNGKLRIMQIDEGLGRSDMLAQSIFDTGNEVIARVNVKENVSVFVEKYDPDLVMIDMSYPTEEILKDIVYINNYSPRPIVFFADHSETDVIDAVVKAGVSAFVVDGLSAKRIKPVMDLAMARFRQNQSIKEELDKTRQTLAERKVIDKAKGILMKQKSMDEETAYKTLRNLAMNQNKKIGSVAKEVIDVAGLLI